MDRVAVIFHHIGPYHHARLNAASGIADVVGMEWSAKGTYAWGSPHAGGKYERVSLSPNAGRRVQSSGEMHSWICAALEKTKPDIVFVNGWGDFGAVQTIIALEKYNIPAVLMSETNAADHPRHSVTESIKRRLVALFQAGLCGGTLAKSYLAELGFPQDRIFVGYDVVDNAYFAMGARKAREAGGLPASIDPAWRGRYFLASARFVPKKNLPFLLEAFARYRRATGASAWPLVLLGDGPMRGELENRRGALGLETLVVMPGFTHYDELPLYYGNAGVFIHASTTEQWGLVVNEAMASGLPVLVSERCGCAPDLVEDGRNGHTFDPRDAGELAGLMAELASDGYDRAAAGKASQEIIAGWSPQTFAEGLRLAASAALEAPRRRANALDKTLLWALSHR